MMHFGYSHRYSHHLAFLLGRILRAQKDPEAALNLCS